MRSIRVLVADDHEGFRRSLIGFLRAQRGVEIIGEAADGIEAVDQTEKLRPDLVLIDSDMPNQDGFRAARQIKLRSPEIRVVVLSMHDGDIYRRMARQHDADGFIEKGSIKHALLALLVSEQARVGGVAAVGIHAS
jgi:DNA-binding NarL/FixJ family response regulator